MSIGEFASVKRFVGSKENQAEAESRLQQSQPDRHEKTEVPSVGSRWKLFEIDQCANGRIFLTYQVRPELDVEPAIWLFLEEDGDTSGNWYHLADNFTKYLRMMLVHLGLPLWQFCVVGIPLPTWIEQVYYLVGPHLLPAMGKPTETVSGSIWKDGPLNTIDTAIFKGRESKQRNSRKK